MRRRSTGEGPHDEATRRENARHLAARLGGDYVHDYVLGANDGVITTFAVIAGATGGALGALVIIVLGFANLVADALSMGAGSYLGRKSNRDYVRSQRELEEWEIDNLPESEKAEVVQIFRDRGLSDNDAATAADAICSSRQAWLDVMLAHELGLQEENGSPIKHGLATFTAFIIAGAIPLIPYLFCSGPNCFIYSATAAAITLWTAGALRTLITGVNWLRGGLEMLGIGSIAALAAYGIGSAIATIT